MTTGILLCISNVFMTFAWYGHLKYGHEWPLWRAIVVSWAIALFEYCLAVPANRLGNVHFSGFQLKIIQEGEVASSRCGKDTEVCPAETDRPRFMAPGHACVREGRPAPGHRPLKPIPRPQRPDDLWERQVVLPGVREGATVRARRRRRLARGTRKPRHAVSDLLEGRGRGLR